MRRSEQLADPTKPDSFEDDGADRLPAVTAARPSPPPMIPTLPRKLDATPHSKLVALRYQCDTLRALVAVHDAKIHAAEHQLANAVRSIEEYENEPIRRRPEQSPGWMNALAIATRRAPRFGMKRKPVESFAKTFVRPMPWSGA